jgi:hypothetical protein
MSALVTNLAKFGVLLACATGGTGCYWSSQPQVPHRLTELDLASIQTLGMPQPRPLTGSRIVILGRFDSTAPQPVGGLYDKREYEVAPLYRTYFFKDGAVEIFEHVSDGLRASGLIVLKDYAGHAEPALLEAPMRAKDPILVTATLTALQHDQINETNDAKFEAGRVEVAVRVTDSKGGARLAKSYVVTGRIPYDGSTELLRLLGWKLAEQLSADPQFVQAIAAQPRAQ